jgi:hypothetical protein
MENFTKKDLKIGYLIEYRDGERAIIMPTTTELIATDCKGVYMDLKNYRDDLTYNAKIADQTRYDIVAVWGWSCLKSGTLNTSTEGRTLLWEEGRKQMTIKEIEAELGYRIRIVDNI